MRIERTPVGEPDANGVLVDAYLNIAEVQVFAKFRPTLDIGIHNGQLVVAWDSDAFSTLTLEKSTSLGGTWSSVTSTSPFTGTLGATTFYRLKSQ